MQEPVHRERPVHPERQGRPARRVPLPSMLRCPPPLAARVARLNALEAPPMPPLDIAEGPRISLVGVGPIEMRPRYRWPGVWF